MTSRVILDEGYLPRNVYLGLFLGDIVLFWGHWLGTEPTAVMDDVFCIAKKGRMTVQVDLAILLVPLRIEQEILGVKQFLNLFGMVFRAVWDRECVWSR